NIDNRLVSQSQICMSPPRDPTNQTGLASIEDNNDLGRNALCTLHLLKSFGNLTQPRNIIQPGDDGQIADLEDLVRPIKPCRRHIDDHEIVFLRNASKESIKRSHVQLNRTFSVSRHCEHVDTAPRVTADKKTEQLRIETVRVVDDLLDVEPWLDVEIIEDMTGLKIEIKQANPPTARWLVALNLHGGFDRKRGIAAPAAARHECHDRRSSLFIAARTDLFPARARNDVQDLLRSAFYRYPVSASAAH